MRTRPLPHRWLPATIALLGAFPLPGRARSPAPLAPGDSRYPVEPPRPTGAWLVRLPPGVVLLSEALILHCTGRGLACRIHQRFRIRVTGAGRRVRLGILSPTVPRVRLDGRPVALADWPADWHAPARTLQSSNQSVHPDTGHLFRLEGPHRKRRLRRYSVFVLLAPGRTQTLSLSTASVAGFDRTSRPRTQPEVSYALNRRKDPFTYHHEIRLADPEARVPVGGRAGHLEVVVTAPARLDLSSRPRLGCRRKADLQRCTGRLPAKTRWFRVCLTEHRAPPVGTFATLGAAFTRQGAEAWLRAGLALLLRRRRDVLALAGETDAHRRLGFSLVYQLFLPYAPSTHEMGAHAELGVVLDILPRVREAVRLGGAFHMSLFRVNLLADLYPDALGGAHAPAWRILLGAGIGL